MGVAKVQGSTPATLEAKLTATIAPIVAAADLDLIEVRLGKGGRGTTISVFIDRFPGRGGVDVADCARVSRRLGAAFEADDPMSGAWDLEVSSPGPKRRLRGPADVARYLGVRARVALRERGERGRETVLGALLAGDDNGISLRVDGGATRTIAWSETGRATLDPTPSQWLAMGRALAEERLALGIPLDGGAAGLDDEQDGDEHDGDEHDVTGQDVAGQDVAD